jgi:hypothetical protein
MIDQCKQGLVNGKQFSMSAFLALVPCWRCRFLHR